MPPKNNQGKKKQNLSKEDKRLESYLNHPANIQNNQSEQITNQPKKGKIQPKTSTASTDTSEQQETENKIAQLLKEVDINKPLPDFTPLDNSIKILKNTVEEMDTLIGHINSHNTAALGIPPVEEETSSFKNQVLTPEISRKKDQIIKDVNKTIEYLQTKKNRIDELIPKENMQDLKDQLVIISHNLNEDIKSKHQILSIF